MAGMSWPGSAIIGGNHAAYATEKHCSGPGRESGAETTPAERTADGGDRPGSTDIQSGSFQRDQGPPGIGNRRTGAGDHDENAGRVGK